MLRLSALEEIQQLLLGLPPIVQTFDDADPDFVRRAKDWLTRAERVLIDNRLSIAAEVAGSRAEIIAAERGVLPAKLPGHRISRKVRDAVAAVALHKASGLIAEAIKQDAMQAEEAARIMRQVVAVAESKGLVRPVPAGSERSQALAAMLEIMSQDVELRPAVTHAAGLVARYDALIILDRLIPAG